MFTPARSAQQGHPGAPDKQLIFLATRFLQLGDVLLNPTQMILTFL
jgi:hypothetical protein